MHHNYTYVIININDIDLINNIYDTNKLRWNKLNTKCLIKFLGDCPNWCINRPLYNKNKILKILKDW